MAIGPIVSLLVKKRHDSIIKAIEGFFTETVGCRQTLWFSLTLLLPD